MKAPQNWEEEIGADNTKKSNIISHTHLTKNVMLHKHPLQSFVATASMADVALVCFA